MVITPQNGMLVRGIVMAVTFLPSNKLPECPPLSMVVRADPIPDGKKIPNCGILEGTKANLARLLWTVAMI